VFIIDWFKLILASISEYVKPVLSSNFIKNILFFRSTFINLFLSYSLSYCLLIVYLKNNSKQLTTNN